MSTQPSKHSKTKKSTRSKWEEIGNFTAQLIDQSDLESQIKFVIESSESLFSSKSRIWLADSIQELLNAEILNNFGTTIKELTELMAEVYKTKHILPDLCSDSEGFTSVIAFPLVISNEILGIIQLDRKDHLSFDHHELKFILFFALQVAIALDNRIDSLRATRQQNQYEMLLSISKLDPSIYSDQNIDNLIKSIVTSLYNIYPFTRVSIYLVHSEALKSVKRISISSLGFESDQIVYYDNFETPLSWSIRNQEVIIINHTLHENIISETNIDTQCKSEMIIPLISGDAFIGNLDVCCDRENFLNSEMVDFLQIFAENIALVIRNTLLFRTELQHRQFIEHLKEALGRISPSNSYEEVINKILIELENNIHNDAAYIWLFDNETSESGIDQFRSVLRFQSLRLRNDHIFDSNENKPQKLKDIQNQLRLLGDDNQDLYSEYPWFLEVLNSKLPIIIQTHSPIEPLGSIFLYENTCSMGIPLFLGDQPLGLIISISRNPDAYSDESLMVATLFMKYVPVVLENARLFSVAHEQVWTVTVLQQIIDATQSITSLDNLLEVFTSMLVDLIGINSCLVYLFDVSRKIFSPQASSGLDEEEQARLNSFDILPGTVGAFENLIQYKNPVIMNGETLSDEIATLIFPAYDFKTDLLILFPLLSQDNFVGALLIDFTDASFQLSSSQKKWDDMFTLILGISQQLATAIENHLNIKLHEEEAYISVALLQVAQAIVSLNKLDEILGAIVRITPILVGVKKCVIYLWDKENNVFYGSENYGFSKSEISVEEQVIKADEYPLIKIIIDHNKAVYFQYDLFESILDLKNISSNDIHIVEGISSQNHGLFTIQLDNQVLFDKEKMIFGFPLSVKDEVLGIMLIEEEEPIRGVPSYHIREKRFEIINGITQLAALAIKNELLQADSIKSERMEQELMLARDIQRTFLPDRVPNIAGWDIDVRWHPAKQVAGDFYDILFLDENKLGFVIADVADKGMPAALFMTLIRTLIRSTSKEHKSPAAVLKQVNELLVPDTKNGMFVTVFFAVIDLDTGWITYANAGHNPPLIKFNNLEKLVELNRTCMALGILEDIIVDECRLCTNPGDWIFFYTDGVTESFSKDQEMYGTNRLYKLLLKKEYSSSKDILDSVEKSVNTFINGTTITDDITLAVIKNKLNN
jgi:serine phosphatase RsbU (regulator of sigma subunit)/GAF domain-containing protein